ncbi:MAG: hypothetical protein ACR2F2_08620 [Pyrinomonadaceae bacterium]
MSKEKNKPGEHGGAGAKLLIVLTVLILAGHAGINYVPVAYSAESFKQDMQTAVVQGLATPSKAGKPTDFVKAKIERAVRVNDIPEDAFIEVKQNGKVIEAHVAYTQSVNILPFGIYKYEYVFDHTATPTGFLLRDD